jgi:hypothetical protein
MGLPPINKQTEVIQMNQKLVEFLQNLTDSEADKVWLWLDGNPDAIGDMIAVLVDAHPNILQPS